MSELSKRELLAGMAMQGQMSCESWFKAASTRAAALEMRLEDHLASMSVRFSDALLAELEKTAPKLDRTIAQKHASELQQLCDIIIGGSNVTAPFSEVKQTLIEKLSVEEPKPVADDGGWIAHKPGDPMPCDERQVIDVICQGGSHRHTATAGYFQSFLCNDWKAKGIGNPSREITAWRPAR